MNIRELQQKLTKAGYEDYSVMLEPYAAKTGRIHHVGVAGTSSAGKSTIINSILGRDIVPISIIPSDTKIIVEHSMKEEVILPDGSVHPLESAEEFRGKVPEMTIHAQLPENDIEFTEFPGLIGADVASFTELYCCDCVILVMRASQFMNINERRFIADYIKYIGPERIMLAVNKLPERESDRTQAVTHTERIIASSFHELRYVFADSEGWQESLRNGIRAMLNTNVPVSSSAMREHIASMLEKELARVRSEAKKKGELIYKENEDSFIVNDALTQFGADSNMAVKVLQEGISREISELSDSAIDEFRKNGRKWFTDNFRPYVTDALKRIASQYVKESNERLREDTIRLSISLPDDSLEGSELRKRDYIGRFNVTESGHDWEKIRPLVIYGVPVASVIVASLVSYFSITAGIVTGFAILGAGVLSDFVMKARNKMMNADIERSIKLTMDNLSGELISAVSGEIISAYNHVEEEFRIKSSSVRHRSSYDAADENSETAEKIHNLEELIGIMKGE